jgi:DNA (cytosine-5)-methyltransferase 1
VRDGATGLRLLTVNECKAIQGYPKNFVVPVSRTSMHHQFGNSVAVPVIESIAKKLVKQLLDIKE